MLKAFATPQHRRVTFIFLVVFCLAAIATLAIGLDGNTPALVLAFVAATALLLAFVHPWRRAREFRYLLYASGLGSVVFVVLRVGHWPRGCADHVLQRSQRRSARTGCLTSA